LEVGMEQAKQNENGSQAAPQEDTVKYASKDHYTEQAKIIVSMLTMLQNVIVAHMRKSEFPDKTRSQVLGQIYSLIGNILKETV
jgi:hypothetical protein